jgi:hypothetical protein
MLQCNSFVILCKIINQNFSNTTAKVLLGEEKVATRRNVLFLRLSVLLIFILFSACSVTYQSAEYTFTPPSGFTTKQYESPSAVSNNAPQLMIFSQKGHLYFQVFRQIIPSGRNLDAVFTEYVSHTSKALSRYQLISKESIELNNQTAIEYVHREFQGEPYVQRREIWMERSGWAYSLVCTDPVDSTPGMIIPISDLCIRLVEGFQFK